MGTSIQLGNATADGLQQHSCNVLLCYKKINNIDMVFSVTFHKGIK